MAAGPQIFTQALACTTILGLKQCPHHGDMIGAGYHFHTVKYSITTKTTEGCSLETGWEGQGAETQSSQHTLLALLTHCWLSELFSGFSPFSNQAKVNK